MLRYAAFYNDETYPCSTLWSVCVIVLVYIHLYFGLNILWYGYVCVSVLVFDWTQGVRTTIASYVNCMFICMYVYASVFLFSVHKCIGCLYACVWLSTGSRDHDSLMRQALLSNVISKFVSPIHSYLQQCSIHSCLQQCSIHSCVSIHAFLYKHTAIIQLWSTWVLVCIVQCHLCLSFAMWTSSLQSERVHFLGFSGPQGDGGTIALVHHVLSSTQPCSLALVEELVGWGPQLSSTQPCSLSQPHSLRKNMMRHG